MRPLSTLILAALLACGASAAEQQVLKYHDGKPDGRKSLAFAAPDPGWALRAIRIHGSRYGLPEAPDIDFYIFLTDAGGENILHTETAAYEKFDRGDAGWVEVKFKKPVAVPKQFCAILDFKALQTMGVYVSYDTSTGGKHSKVGLPGKEGAAVDFGGDWMIEAVIEKR
jgi:RNA polymerase sigma-70 factor (ECF subfamily)